MERVKGIEPSSQPWEGHILPLNHTRTGQITLQTMNRDFAVPPLISKPGPIWQLLCASL